MKKVVCKYWVLRMKKWMLVWGRVVIWGLRMSEVMRMEFGEVGMRSWWERG